MALHKVVRYAPKLHYSKHAESYVKHQRTRGGERGLRKGHRCSIIVRCAGSDNRRRGPVRLRVEKISPAALVSEQTRGGMGDPAAALQRIIHQQAFRRGCWEMWKSDICCGEVHLLHQIPGGDSTASFGGDSHDTAMCCAAQRGAADYRGERDTEDERMEGPEQEALNGWCTEGWLQGFWAPWKDPLLVSQHRRKS